MNVVTSRSRFLISIRFGVTTALTVLILLTTATLSFFLIANLRQILRDELQKQLSIALRSSSLLIDGSLLPLLATPDQENGETYLTVKKSLQIIKNAIPDLHFVYTMRKDESNKFVFVVDAETNPNTISHIGDVYSEPTPTMVEAFESKSIGKTFIEREPSPDEWGTWLSGFIVLGDGKGNVVGILGMDISASTIRNQEFKTLSIILGISITVALVMLFLSVLLSRGITQPLNLLAADMEKITKLQIDESNYVFSHFKEIDSISNATIDVKSSLQSFKRYVPSDLVAELISLRKHASLGGIRRNLTILFSDIEDFTNWSENIDPEQLINVMAGYFRGMTKIIHNHHGTVDKYIGDSIMAFWGAPNPIDSHAEHASLAALECLKFQEEFNLELKNAGMSPLNTRFGINTGEVLVGNVGYEDRFNYTVIGDQVNLASRLEGLNKLYKTNILLSESTKSNLGEHFCTRPLDKVIVKGKTVSIRVYELMSIDDEKSNEQQQSKLNDLASKTLRAYELYDQRDWSKALFEYELINRSFPDDHISSIMQERCRKFIDQEPGPDWQGAVILREK